MFAHPSIVRTLLSASTFGALALSLVACNQDQVTDLGTGDASVAQKPQPAEFSFQGAPSYMLPPHARTTSPDGAARLPDGYAYAYGQLNDALSFGLYTSTGSTYTYVSTSIWAADGNSVSQSMDIDADGSQWIQNGSYDTDGQGGYAGAYTTTQVDSHGVSTLYLTDFQSSSTGSEYSSSVDKADTSVVPDFLYYSLWTPESSYSSQIQHRPDGSTASCEYDYTTHVSGGATNAVQEYRSSQDCDDSRTTANPDFHSESLSTYAMNTGAYTSVGSIACVGVDGTNRALTYNTNDGWLDENGNSLVNPYEICAFSGFSMY